MARKSFSHYETFLDNVGRFWDYFGTGFKLHQWGLEDVTQTKADLADLNQQIMKIELRLELLRTQRDTICKDVEKLNGLLRVAALAKFAANDPIMAVLPRLMKATVGRPNKAAAARKAATVARKLAAEASVALGESAGVSRVTPP